MDLPPGTPVRAQTQTHIAAAPAVVWAVLSEIESWPDWNPDVKWVKVDGPLEAGTSFRWKSGRTSISSTIRVVEPKRVLAWTGILPGVRALHVWRLTADRAGTLVWTGETFEGLLPRLFRKRLSRTLETALNDGIVALRAECERRVSDQAA